MALYAKSMNMFTIDPPFVIRKMLHIKADIEKYFQMIQRFETYVTEKVASPKERDAYIAELHILAQLYNDKLYTPEILQWLPWDWGVTPIQL